MEMIKYNSIENHYNQKFISPFIKHYGKEINHATYVLQEKLHGSNIQLIFTKGNLEYSVASRNEIIEPGKKFFEIWDVLKNKDFSWIHEILHYTQSDTLHIYGELYGRGVQKGVKYIDSQDIKFFDMRIDGRLLPFAEFFILMTHVDKCDEMIPVFAIIDGLENALAFDSDRNTVVGDFTEEEDNICEGVVIKPIHRNFYNHNNELFLIKKKNERFKEKSRERKSVHLQGNDFSEEVNNLREIFVSYVNENRMEGIFSKFGEINNHKDIGKYIGLIMKDAAADFVKDEEFDEFKFTVTEKKYIFGNVNTIVPFLLKHI